MTILDDSDTSCFVKCNMVDPEIPSEMGYLKTDVVIHKGPSDLPREAIGPEGRSVPVFTRKQIFQVGSGLPVLPLTLLTR